MKFLICYLTRFLSLCLCICLFSCYSSALFAQSLTGIKSSTQALVYYSELITAGKTLTEVQLKDLLKVAKARQQQLLDNLGSPKQIQPFLLSEKTIHALPDQAKPFLEKDISGLEGTLEIRAALTNNNKETLEYLLIKNDQVYYLHFTDKVPDNLKTGDKIRVLHAIQVARDELTKDLVLSKNDLSITQHYLTAKPLSLGPQKTITFLVNFSDKPDDRPWTTNFIDDLMYNRISSMFYESSYQQTTVVGKTVGWYVLSLPSSTSCSTLPNLVSTQADQAAINDGVDLSQYDRKVYIFPKTSSCGWAGLGVVGGTNTRSWVNGAASTIRTPGHELGHNFGIYHSKLLSCSDSPNTGTCSRSEYGDGTDIMGAGRQTHFNAFQKDVLGWLNYNVSPPITLVTAPGVYKIEPLETLGNNPKALKVLKREGTSDYYYIEYRQGIGFDAELANCGTQCNYTKGVVFHQGNTTTTNSSDLLDMSWTDTTTGRVALLPGQSWSDPGAPNGGVTFSLLSVDATGATVKIAYGGCVK